MKKRFEVKTISPTVLEKWRRKWKLVSMFADLTSESKNMKVAVLRHPFPSTKTTLNRFIDMHMRRVKLQKYIAEAVSPNPGLARVQGMAMPIMAGYDPTHREFVTIMRYDQAQKFPAKPNLEQYIALELSLCKIWSLGYQLAHIDKRSLSLAKLPSLDVLLYDSSQLIGKVRWISERFSTIDPASIGDARFESYYVPSGDTAFLNTLLTKLSLQGGSANSVDARLNAIRMKMWTRHKNIGYMYGTPKTSL